MQLIVRGRPKEPICLRHHAAVVFLAFLFKYKIIVGRPILWFCGAVFHKPPKYSLLARQSVGKTCPIYVGNRFSYKIPCSTNDTTNGPDASDNMDTTSSLPFNQTVLLNLAAEVGASEVYRWHANDTGNGTGNLKKSTVLYPITGILTNFRLILFYSCLFNFDAKQIRLISSRLNF